MADITTNLNRTPYFDDFDDNKKFYKVLYKPGTAVQARELTQVQTILQRQISRFGSHVFRNGSIVDGVNPAEIDNVFVVRVKNTFSNASVVDVDVIANYSNNLEVVSQTTGLRAKLVHTIDGAEASTPNTKRLYVTYPSVDTTQTKTSSGTLALTNGSNTVTGTSTAFTTYAVGDVVTIFETAAQGKVSFNATIASIANNISMDLNRALVFANSGISSSNFIVSNKITAFGQIGTDASPEVLDVVAPSVLNSQSNTVNTAVNANTFALDFTATNTSLIEVRVNGALQKSTIDFTPTTTDVTFKVDLINGDSINIIERELVTAFSGISCYSQSTTGVVTSEESKLVRNEDGVVYHKGHFLNIDKGITVVSDNLIGANNAQVVVRTDESIVTYKSDTSLLDNAAGFSNESAPGADRLKLDPTLDTANTANLINQSAAAVIFDFNDRGQVRVINDDPQYAELGRQLAIRKDETAGNFTTAKFDTDVEASSNNETMNIVVGTGVGYVDGYRIETQAPTRRAVDRGIETETKEDIETVMTQGNVIRVHGLVGNFMPHYDIDFVKNTSGGTAIDMYSNSSTYSTFDGLATGSIPASTTRVGRGIVKAIDHVSGTPGSNTAVYDISLYDVVAETGQDLSTARSITARRDATGFQQAATAAADITLLDGTNALRNTDLLPFASFGEEAMKQITDGVGTYDNSWTVRRHSRVSDTLQANGLAVIDVDDESDFSYTKSIGAYTDAESDAIILTNVGSAITCTAAANGSIANTTVTVPAATSGYIHVGDVISVGGGAEAYVTTITNSTTVEIDRDLGTVATGVLTKHIPVGKSIAIDGDMTTTDQGANELQIRIPTLNDGNWSGTTSVVATYEFNTTDVKPATKTIRKDRYFAINTANNAAGRAGPWQIGSAVDVHKVTGVYLLTNGASSVTNTTVVSGDLTGLKNYADGEFFAFDSGQRDFFYDYAKLQLTNKGLRNNILDANSTVLVKYDYFETQTSDGTGYFTIDSYPSTTENTANSSTILLEEVPSFITSAGGQIDLRNVIDHRPVRKANTYSTIAAATASADVVGSRDNVNNNGFPVTFKDDSEFVTDYQIYKSRRSDVYLSRDSSIAISDSKGMFIPAPIINDGMLVASIGIPPLPTLTTAEAFSVTDTKTGGRLADRRTTFDITDKEVDIEHYNVRGYTMKDIGALAQRIDNLEYYVSMNALETDIFNKQFKNDSGIERFKNGVFVDPFGSSQFAQTTNPEYSAGIDQENEVLRPPMASEDIQRMKSNIQSGDLIRKNQKMMFNYTEQDLIKQDKATKVRPAAPLAIRYNADVFLLPEYDVGASRVDNQPRVARPVVNNRNRARRRGRNGGRVAGRDFPVGLWRPDPALQRATTAGERERLRRLNREIWGEWNATGRRAAQQRAPGRGQNQGSGSGRGGREFVSNVDVKPFIRSMVIGFIAYGLRPNTIHSTFFNRVNVDEHVSPAVIGRTESALTDAIADAGETIQTTDITGEIDTSRGPAGILSPTGLVGAPIVSDAAGTVAGIFLVPTDTFLQGERELSVADVQDLETEEDAILSSGSAKFYSNRLDVQFRRLPPPPAPPRPPAPPAPLWPRRIRRDPIAQTFFVPRVTSGRQDDSGVTFVSSIDIFFRTRGTHAVQVYLCEVANGTPNPDNTLPGSRVRVQAADINVTQDGSTATTFEFNYPVKLFNDQSYAFVIKPDLDDPDYDVYFAELGEKDLITGNGVNTQPALGVAFLGSNQDTWSAIQDEDIKFTLRRAKFSTGTGLVRFTGRNREYMDELESITYLNNNTQVLPGDLVIGTTSANSDPAITVANANTNIFGIVDEVDTVNDTIIIEPSTGLFDTSSAKVFSTTLRDGTTQNTTKHKIAFYRPQDGRTEVGTLVQERFVGSTFGVIGDHEFSLIAPQFTTEAFSNSSISMSFTYNVSNTASVSMDIPDDGGEIEYTEQPLRARSATRDINLVGSATSGKSFYIDATMTNNNERTSPMIDLRRSLVTLVGNLTTSPNASNNHFITGASVDYTANASIYSEMFDGVGETNVRYISEVIELDEGQDAEDLKLFLSAYRPPRGRIDVFVRAAHRFENVNDKLWAPMKLVNDTVYSARNFPEDVKELEYRMHTTTEMAATGFAGIFDDTTASDYAYAYTEGHTAASLIATNASTGIAEYESGGNTYTGYKTFQIKIVLYATVDGLAGYGEERSSNPPILHDVRAVALQV